MISRARPPLASGLLGAVLALAAAAGTAACNEKALDGSRRAAADAAPAAGGLSPEQAARVVAKVGDRAITLGDYAATLERMDQFDRLRYQSPERRKELLDEIIDVELLAQEARAKGLDKEPETEEAVRQILRDAILGEVRKTTRAPADIQAPEVRAYYESHKDEFREPERRRVAHLAVKDKETAQKLLAEAKKASPMQWGELVTKHSLDAPPKPSSVQPLEMAGDLGIVGAPGDTRGDNPRVPREVREALFEIKGVGDVLDRPVQADGRWHVLRMTGKTEAHERSLAEADRTIRITIMQREIADKEKALEAELRKQFAVSIDEKALGTVEVPTLPEEAADAGAAPASAGDAGK